MEDFVSHLPRSVQNKLRETSAGMYTKKRLPNGKVQVTGGKRLKSSGAYSTGFSKQVAKFLLKNNMVSGLCFSQVCEVFFCDSSFNS